MKAAIVKLSFIKKDPFHRLNVDNYIGVADEPRAELVRREKAVTDAITRRDNAAMTLAAAEQRQAELLASGEVIPINTGTEET